MLALQLFLGYEEFPGLDSVVFKSQGEIDTYLGVIFAVLGPKEQISDAGTSFIRGCLTYDSGRRPTARQAFYHSWLQEPESDRKMFKRLESDNVLSWKPQQLKFPVIEDLTTLSLGVNRHEDGHGAQQAAGRDAVSPHFIGQELTGTNRSHKTHIGGSILAQSAGSVPATAFRPGQVQAKRKRTTFNPESGKRPRSSPP
jgi:serine/threonine protein kinase